MKRFYISVLTFLFVSAQVAGAAQICGRVSIKGRGERAKVIMADLQTEAEPVYYVVANPEVQTWQPGSCVCARGTVSCASEENSCDFSIKQITAIDLSGDDCLPTWFP